MPQEINETEKFWSPEHSHDIRDKNPGKMREFEKKSLHDHPAPIPPPTKHIIDDEGEKLISTPLVSLLAARTQLYKS